MCDIEADMNTAPEGVEAAMTYEEWWDEFHANACCPDPSTAARRLCGCGGSAAIPSNISRLLVAESEF